MRGGGGAFASRFGANLAYCRNRAGDISQEELGMRADLHRTAVGQLERGERVARTDTLVKLAGSALDAQLRREQTKAILDLLIAHKRKLSD